MQDKKNIIKVVISQIKRRKKLTKLLVNQQKKKKLTLRRRVPNHGIKAKRNEKT